MGLGAPRALRVIRDTSAIAKVDETCLNKSFHKCAKHRKTIMSQRPDLKSRRNVFEQVVELVSKISQPGGSDFDVHFYAEEMNIDGWTSPQGV